MGNQGAPWSEKFRLLSKSYYHSHGSYLCDPPTGILGYSSFAQCPLTFCFFIVHYPSSISVSLNIKYTRDDKCKMSAHYTYVSRAY